MLHWPARLIFFIDLLTFCQGHLIDMTRRHLSLDFRSAFINSFSWLILALQSSIKYYRSKGWISWTYSRHLFSRCRCRIGMDNSHAIQFEPHFVLVFSLAEACMMALTSSQILRLGDLAFNIASPPAIVLLKSTSKAQHHCNIGRKHHSLIDRVISSSNWFRSLTLTEKAM